MVFRNSRNIVPWPYHFVERRAVRLGCLREYSTRFDLGVPLHCGTRKVQSFQSVDPVRFTVRWLLDALVRPFGNPMGRSKVAHYPITSTKRLPKTRRAAIRFVLANNTPTSSLAFALLPL
jgi:hypothetical protein